MKHITLFSGKHYGSKHKATFALLMFAFFILAFRSYGQGDTESYFQNFAGHSPNSFAFSKINNAPMSLFSGQVNLSLTIFEKQLSALPNFALNLNYTGGGGLKVNTPRTIVGKGWLLNFGGAIIRNKRGVPDDFVNARVYAGSVPTKYNGILFNGGTAVQYNPDGEQTIARNNIAFYYADGAADAQHDIFEFNFFGKSGKFYLGKNGPIQIVTDSRIQIIPTYNTAVPEFTIGSFLIIDESGIKYYFSSIELAKEGYLTIYEEDNIKYYGKEFPSAWLLTKVEAPFNEETIQFEYYHSTDYTSGSSGYGGAYSKRSDQATGTLSTGNDPTVIKDLFPRAITFDDGSKIVFEYFQQFDQNDYLLLKQIKNLNPDQQVTSTFLFSYQGWDSNTTSIYSTSLQGNKETFLAWKYGYYLRDISLISPTQAKQSLYAFDYFIGDNFNEQAFAGSHGIDFWGYYNGKINQSLILYPTQYQSTIPDRNPDAAFAKLGSLKKIIYPTGGWEEFDYELNDKLVSGVNEPIGGIRIKKRILHDGADAARDIVKQYKYVEVDGTTSSGFLGEKPEFTFVYNVYHQSGWPDSPSLKYTITNTFAYPVNPLSSVEGNFVGYRRVEELFQNSSVNTGKIVYEYTDLTDVDLWYPPDYYPYRPVDRPYWAVGLPKKITHFSSNGDKIREVINDYNILEDRNLADNFRSMQVVKKGEGDLFQPSGDQLRFLYKFTSYYPVIGRTELIATHEYDYSSTTPQTSKYTLTQKTYDPNYFVLRTSSAKNSKGETIRNKNFYSFDFAISGSSHFTTKFQQKNIFNIPLLAETWLVNASGSYLVNSEATEYSELPGNIIRPSTLYAADLDAPLFSSLPDSFNPSIFLQTGRNYQPKSVFKTYDPIGRLVEYEKEGGIRSSIIMDESGNVIAKGDNVAFNSFAYSGFESNETGNWSYILSGINSAEAKTGSKSYNGTISKESLPTGYYQLSFWAKGSGSITFNGTSQPIDSSWKLYKLSLTSVSSISINTNGNLIDEIILHRQEGNAFSYNYKKGIGISSASDLNGEITYFEYDEFNRLRDVKDQIGNLLKSYNHHFKNPIPSTSKATTLTRNNCPSGYQPGPPVTFVVPAGKYYSIISQIDADAQANSDIYYNGQNYVNANGTCNLIYYNTAISAPFTKNDCPTGTVTSPVYYLVEAQKYSSIISQSDADSKAQNDLTINGQAYANTNGVCRQLITVSLSNSTGVMLKVSFSGMGTQYDFPPGSSSLQIPQNSYTVYVVDPASVSHSYWIGARSTIIGISATFNDVIIGPGSAENNVNASN